MDIFDSITQKVTNFLSSSYPHIYFHTENNFEVDDEVPEYPENTYTRIIRLYVKGIELYEILIIHHSIDTDFLDDTIPQQPYQPEYTYDYPYIFKINNVFHRFDDGNEEHSIIEEGFSQETQNKVIEKSLGTFDRNYLRKDNVLRLLLEADTD